jgi:hypothetical protein
LFLLDDVRLVGCVKTDGELGDGIGSDVVRFEIIGNGRIVVGTDDNDEVDVDDEAK